MRAAEKTGGWTRTTTKLCEYFVMRCRCAYDFEVATFVSVAVWLQMNCQIVENFSPLLCGKIKWLKWNKRAMQWINRQRYEIFAKRIKDLLNKRYYLCAIRRENSKIRNEATVKTNAQNFDTWLGNSHPHWWHLCQLGYCQITQLS